MNDVKKFSDSDLNHLIKLSKLSVSVKESKQYVSQLSEILNYVAKLQELDLEKVEETNQVTGLKNIEAEDVVDEGLDREEVLAQSPNTHEGYVLVPAILAGNDDA